MDEHDPVTFIDLWRTQDQPVPKLQNRDRGAWRKKGRVERVAVSVAGQDDGAEDAGNDEHRQKGGAGDQSRWAVHEGRLARGSTTA